ncbi:MAG: VOC family protein [Acidimicrobiales bacterium]
MREQRDAFHLAIPAWDLGDAQAFYVAGLGCHLARRYPDRITLDFFGDQVVCHLIEPPVPGRAGADDLQLYPRHFGVTFRAREDFDAVLALAEQRKLELFRTMRPRFEGMAEEHLTFVLRDPSDNLIEFKHYRDARMMY